MAEKRSLRLSFFPHIRDKASTTRIMLDVIIALLPATVFGVVNFGLYALLIILVCVATCLVFELLWCIGTHSRKTVRDLSAVVTGLILALNLPPTVPLWMAAFGAAFAIIVVKLLFGGLGQNFMNPAAAAKCFLLISFSGQMNNFIYQGLSAATPMEIIRVGGNIDLLQMLLGNTAGCIGETCAIALILGGAYLIARRIIDFRIPLFYILSVVIYMSIYSIMTRGAIDWNLVISVLLGGGILLAAFFMATDYVTSPVTPVGRAIFAVFVGAMTCTLWLFGVDNGFISYAIILGNLIVPILEMITKRKSFGKGA